MVRFVGVGKFTGIPCLLDVVLFNMSIVKQMPCQIYRDSMSPRRSREEELEWRRKLLARGIRIDDAVFGWRDCMRELKEAENMFRKTQSSH